MPNFDRTGPQGEGPNTGRGMGDCNDQSNTPNQNFRNAGRSFSRGFGRGFRRGFRGGFCPFFGRRRVSKQDLQDYKADLKAEIEELDKEIENYKD